MSNKDLYNKKYKSSRNYLLKLWDEVCFFGPNKDMFGIPMSKDNYATTHHIYDDEGNYIGLAVLSNYIHGYLDTYLKNYDKDEYNRWNDYLHLVTKYLNSHKSLYIESKLIYLRNELLNYAYNDKKNKNKTEYKKLNKLISLIGCVHKDDHVKKYDELVSDFFYSIEPLEFNSLTEGVIYWRMLSNSESKYDFRESVIKYIDSIKNPETAMLSNTCAPVIIDGNITLSKNDIEFLKYLKSKDYLSKWNRLFYAIKHNVISEHMLKENIKILRTSYFDILYTELNKNENNKIKKSIESKMYEVSFDKRCEIYETNNLKEQVCLEYVKMLNESNKEDIFVRNDIYYNDAMGLEYSSLGLDNKEYYLSLIGKDLLEKINYTNPELYKRWKTFFKIFTQNKPKKKVNERYKKYLLQTYHNCITLLRRETKEFYENKLRIAENKFDKIKYKIYIDAFSDKPIRTFVRCIDSEYDSRNFQCNAYISPFTDVRLNSHKLIDQSKQDILYRQNCYINNIICNNVKEDWFGLTYKADFDENMIKNKDLNENIFLHDRSMYLLELINKYDSNLYNEWIDLFNEITKDESVDHSREIYTLLSKSYILLKENCKNYDSDTKNHIKKMKAACNRYYCS